MTLRDLDARWAVKGGRVVGVRFTCPVNDGDGPHREGHQIAVLFTNPPDGGPPHPPDPGCVGDNGGRRWSRAGDTLDDLTLVPSIDCTVTDRACWHGFVVAGRVS